MYVPIGCHGLHWYGEFIKFIPLQWIFLRIWNILGYLLQNFLKVLRKNCAEKTDV